MRCVVIDLVIRNENLEDVRGYLNDIEKSLKESIRLLELTSSKKTYEIDLLKTSVPKVSRVKNLLALYDK